MNNAFSTELVGKKKITSHLTLCAGCHQLRLLSSYMSTRVAMFFSLPLLPVGKVKILDECPTCGHRGEVTARHFHKERKKNLSLMMEGFTHSADDPDNCCLALHTLMMYDEVAWFQDVQKTYGVRFENNMDVQLLIARGLCRFGVYDLAIEHCRKAIALDGGKSAEELLEFCLAALVATKHSLELEQWIVKEEPVRAAYIPIASLAVLMVVYFSAMGISSLRNYKAWLINGSLRPYSFLLDDKRYTLGPGECKQTTLRLGEHELKQETMPATRFTYAIPLIKQLLDKHVLVINPDAMAFLAISNPTEETTSFSHGEQIRLFSGIGQSLRVIRKHEESKKSNDLISLYRPDTHLALVNQIQRLGQEQTAIRYARQALTMEPDTSETPELLEVALQQAEDQDARAFLRQGLDHSPILLPWHLKYQNYMMEHQPEYNLEHEYTRWCNNHPDEAASYYLLARVVNERSSAYKFFEFSETLPGMEGEGYQAIARSLYVRGQFAEALPYSQKAVAVNTTNAVFLDLNEQLHLVMREYDELVEHAKTPRTDLSALGQAQRTVLYLTCAGYHREAESEAVRLSRQNAERLSALNAVRFYAVGNIDAYLTCLADAGDGHAKMEEILHRNLVNEADQLASQSETLPYWEHLVLFCAAMNQGLLEIADSTLQKAVLEAGHGTLGRHNVAKLLADNSAPSIAAIRNLDIDAQEKAVLCVALGYRFPEHQPSLNKLAEEYNFNRTYPQLLLKKWMRAAATEPSQSRNTAPQESLKTAP